MNSQFRQCELVVRENSGPSGVSARGSDQRVVAHERILTGFSAKSGHVRDVRTRRTHAFLEPAANHVSSCLEVGDGCQRRAKDHNGMEASVEGSAARRQNGSLSQSPFDREGDHRSPSSAVSRYRPWIDETFQIGWVDFSASPTTMPVSPSTSMAPRG